MVFFFDLNNIMAQTYGIDRQPTQLDYASPTQFKFSIMQLPKVEFFTTAANLPGITLADAIFPTPFTDIPVQGDKLTFEQFTMTFIVSEDISNYLEIYNWMVAIGFPDSHKQFTLKTSSLENASIREPQTIRSDMSVIITTNKSNPNFNITFKDAFPVSLGNISLDAATASLEPILVDATFEYVGSFSIEKFN